MSTHRCLLCIAASAALLALAACDSTSDDDKPKVEGKRISVMALEKQLVPDPSLAGTTVVLPHPAANRDWPESGGTAAHVIGHPALGDTLDTAWSESIGEGTSRYGQTLSSPIAYDGIVYAMDAQSTVTAFDRDGNRLWQTDVTPKDDDEQGYGGGIAYDAGRIYVTSGFAQVIALDAKTGQEIWRVGAPAPIHSAPTVADGRVFCITVDDRLEAYSTADGSKLWDYEGVPESAVLSGGASPAVSGDVVVAPFASGDIVALRADNGRNLWNDNLAMTNRFDPMSTLVDIKGRPVIDGDRVFAIGHGGRMVAIDLRTGERVWEQDISGISQPWVAGDFVFVLNAQEEVICLTRDEGRVRWITQLDQREDPDDPKSDPIEWTGPVLAGDRLIVVSTTGQAWSLSPYTGKVLGRIDLDESAFLAPIVAGKTLYFETADAELTALR